ncbi:unnamed protein product [Vicia faba]|uniref:Reverse transcriptase domain-containing protein n=1 Tax=Vicia faba TaxID=3906 RepID=A0AAV1AKG6_VICFA|nr:unnamed protein product [Vicia faba]
MKIVTEAIENRLKRIFSEIIDVEHTVFVKGRLITNNTFIAMECLHWMKNKTKKKGIMSFKLDMSKAYDMIRWSFVNGVLEAMGFPKTIIVEEGGGDKQYSWDPSYEKGTLNLSLVFLDDILLFARAKAKEAGNIMEILAKYQSFSEQVAKLDKSEVSFSRNMLMKSKI